MTCTCKNPNSYGPHTEVVYLNAEGKVILAGDKACTEHGYIVYNGPILYPVRKRVWMRQGEIAALIQLRNDGRDPKIVEKQSGNGMVQALIEYTDHYTTAVPDGEAQAHYEV